MVRSVQWHNTVNQPSFDSRHFVRIGIFLAIRLAIGPRYYEIQSAWATQTQISVPRQKSGNAEHLIRDSVPQTRIDEPTDYGF